MTFDTLETPVPLVDIDVMAHNLDRMAAKGVKLTSLAEAVKNYPALDKSGGSATEAGEELGATTTDDDDKEAKRKANRAMKKEAEAKEAK